MPESYQPLAQRALAAYGRGAARLIFIQHSDSVTFKVTDEQSAEPLLLRVHVPVAAVMGEHGADPAALRSELQWLEALNRDTSLVLQCPIHNLDGHLVTSQLDEDSGQTVNCTLLTWLDGQPYRGELESESTAAQAGAILATLHRHASTWQVPEGFTRPLRDVAYFLSMLRGLHPAIAQGRIRRQDFQELEAAVLCLAEMMCNIGLDPQRCGVMHADANKGNMLWHNGQLRLIDFSFCAIGDYLFDLSIVMGDMRPELHQSFLAGYQALRPLSPGWRRLVEAFFIGMMVGSFYYLAARPETQAILNRRVPQIAQDYAAPFNRGESFWFVE
jgi:Ser/Thr protein kinase RdoA (MazF antagonist)